MSFNDGAGALSEKSASHTPATDLQLTDSARQKAPTVVIPRLVTEAGETIQTRFMEFFLAHLPNENTREAYGRAIIGFFDWVENNRSIKDLLDIETLDVVAWIDALKEDINPRTKKPVAHTTIEQRLAAVTSLFNWFKLYQLVATNPATPVKLKREKRRHGKTQALSPSQARQLLDSIKIEKIVGDETIPVAAGLRDRALIGLMLFSFARISAAVTVNVGDVIVKEHRLSVTLQEKGGKQPTMPCNHQLETYLRRYLSFLMATQEVTSDTPLFQSFNRSRNLTGRRLDRNEAWYMVRRRAKAAGIDVKICNHTFRATGLTTYLEHPDARLEHAQEMAGHADPSTTLLYDHREEKIKQHEVERILI